MTRNGSPPRGAISTGEKQPPTTSVYWRVSPVARSSAKMLKTPKPPRSDEKKTVLPSREYEGWMSRDGPNVSWVLRVGSLRSTEKIFQDSPILRLYSNVVPSEAYQGLPSKSSSWVRLRIAFVSRSSSKMSTTPFLFPSNATWRPSG